MRSASVAANVVDFPAVFGEPVARLKMSPPNGVTEGMIAPRVVIAKKKNLPLGHGMTVTQVVTRQVGGAPEKAKRHRFVYDEFCHLLR